MNKKIMIVDDEEIIRNGIVTYIDWDRYGYSIVGEAENGKKALEVARQVKPEIILTDIYMPIMDGIEFAREIKKILPDVVIIYLSGYDEFTYAQKAIEIGIFRYITKPLQEPQLLEVLEDARKDLEHRELEKVQVKKLKDLIRDSLPLLKERFFLNLIRGKYKENEIKSKLDYLNIEIPYEQFFCMIISLDDYFLLAETQSEDDLNLIKFAVQNISEEILSDVQGCFFMFEEKQNEIGVLFNYSGGFSSFLSALYPGLQKIQDSMRMYFKTTVTIGIGRSCDSLTKVAESYGEAVEALEFRTMYGKNSILFIGDMKPAAKYRMKADSFEKWNELITAVKSGDLEKAVDMTEKVFQFLKADRSIKKEQIHLLVIQSLIKLGQIILEYDGDITEVYGEKFSPLDLLNYDILEDMQCKLTEIVKKTVEFVNLKRKIVSRNFILKAKEFITESYALEEMNLSMIADKVCVSPGYLSQLFKQVEGESCIEYLTKVRINHAKKLLKETTLKTYEIAEKVGYSDPQYFSTCFKRIVGVSPTAYRDLIVKDIF